MVDDNFSVLCSISQLYNNRPSVASTKTAEHYLERKTRSLVSLSAIYRGYLHYFYIVIQPILCLHQVFINNAIVLSLSHNNTLLLSFQCTLVLLYRHSFQHSIDQNNRMRGYIRNNRSKNCWLEIIKSG